MASEHTYKINLDLSESSQSKVALADFKKAINDSEGDLSKIKSAYKDISDSIEDTSAIEKEMNNQYIQRIKLIDKEIDKYAKELELNKDLTDEGRQTLKNLIAQQDKEKKKLLVQQKEFKLANQMAKVEKNRRGIFADIKKNMTETLKQSKLMQTLLDKELKTRTKIAKVAGSVAKGAIKAVGVGAGIAAGMVGAGIAATSSAANSIVDKADALKSLNPSAPKELVDSMWMKTGADYATIVDAINKIGSIIGFGNDRLENLVSTEIKNPGAGSLIASQRMMDVNANYERLFDAIRRQTGTTDMSALISASQANRHVSSGAISQSDYMLAFAKLTQAGMDADTANRAINAVVRKGGNFLEAFNSTDFSKFVSGQMKNVMNNTDLVLRDLASTNTSESPEAKQAREFQISMRKAEDVKNKIMIKLFKELEPYTDKIVNGLTKLAEQVIPKLPRWIDNIEKLLAKIVDVDLEDIGENVADGIKKTPFLNAYANVGEMVANLASGKFGDAALNALKATPIVSIADTAYQWLKPKPQLAQGGLVMSPSIVGEAGPELVLPLNNPDRCNSIINNYTANNNFNMSAPQSPLSLSQALNNRRFIKSSGGF